MSFDYTAVRISYDRLRFWWVATSDDTGAQLATGPTTGSITGDAREIETTLEHRHRREAAISEARAERIRRERH
jgi:hypothetical protein